MWTFGKWVKYTRAWKEGDLVSIEVDREREEIRFWLNEEQMPVVKLDWVGKKDVYFAFSSSLEKSWAEIQPLI